jgi:hypothetical protein
MKLSLLFSESDYRFRKKEREAAIGGPEEQHAYMFGMRRRGLINAEIPPELINNPSKILEVHKERFGGMRWPEFEDLILNYRKTKSFELGRVGDMTFPTLLAARYALQLDQPWPEFLPLAGIMMKFMFDPSHTKRSRYSTPLRSHRIKSLPMMLAKYCLKHRLTPKWLTDLYGRFKSELENMYEPYYVDTETGLLGSMQTMQAHGVENPQVWIDPETGDPMVGGLELYSPYSSKGIQDREMELSRIVPLLEKLLGIK